MQSRRIDDRGSGSGAFAVASVGIDPGVFGSGAGAATSLANFARLLDTLHAGALT